MQMVWTKDEAFNLQNGTYHTITERSFTLYDVSSGHDVVHYESSLTMERVKPSDSGTYTCSVAVVWDPTERALTGIYKSRVNITAVGKPLVIITA